MEISEILFNELAFFRLMQDLDNSSSIALAAKHKNKKRAEQPSKAKQSLKVRCFFYSHLVFLVITQKFVCMRLIWLFVLIPPFRKMQ